MKNNSSFARVLFFFAAFFSLGEIVNGQFVYLNPTPGSKYRNPQTTLAIKNGALIDESSVQSKDWIELIGSKSGTHSWKARLSDDNKTIIVKPQSVFDYGETVSVTIYSKLKKLTGETIDGKTFSFQIRDEITPELMEQYKKDKLESDMEENGYDPAQQSTTRDFNIDSLPTYVVTINNNPAPGQIFYNNQNDFDPTSTNCINTIIENNGDLVWGDDMGINGHDFKINYNGYLTYFSYSTNHWIMMDSNYVKFDSLTASNGYESETNPHDLSIYPNGHALLLIEDRRTMDMTQYGGQSNASVVSVIIQEQDANRDVVWEWSGWDHFQITDTDPHVILTNFFVDYVHSNAVSFDNDGNVILSSRCLDEVSKINHDTGDFIWRLGGKNNQFTFINDNISQHFSNQHDARRIANGNLTLFNNGLYLQPQRSSAKEYQLDEVNKIATLAWYYEHPDVNGYPVYGPATGSVQRLPNGNTMIDWGTCSVHQDRPSMTEVDSNNNITWEMKFDEYGQKSYRTHKYVWDPCAPLNDAKVKVKKITSSTAKVVWDPVKNATSYDVQYRKVGNVNWKLKNTNNTAKKLKLLDPSTSYEYQVKAYCANGYASDWTPLDTFTTLPLKSLTDENDDALTFEIYPNPASDVLTLTINSDQDQQISICIYDVVGKLMLSKMQTFSAGEQELKLNISALPAGYYLAQISTGTINQTMKFVKQ